MIRATRRVSRSLGVPVRSLASGGSSVWDGKKKDRSWGGFLGSVVRSGAVVGGVAAIGAATLGAEAVYRVGRATGLVRGEEKRRSPGSHFLEWMALSGASLAVWDLVPAFVLETSLRGVLREVLVEDGAAVSKLPGPVVMIMDVLEHREVVHGEADDVSEIEMLVVLHPGPNGGTEGVPRATLGSLVGHMSPELAREEVEAWRAVMTVGMSDVDVGDRTWVGTAAEDLLKRWQHSFMGEGNQPEIAVIRDDEKTSRDGGMTEEGWIQTVIDRVPRTKLSILDLYLQPLGQETPKISFQQEAKRDPTPLIDFLLDELDRKGEGQEYAGNTTNPMSAIEQHLKRMLEKRRDTSSKKSSSTTKTHTDHESDQYLHRKHRTTTILDAEFRPKK